MSGMDKAAVGWSIGIVAVAVGIAFYGLGTPSESPLAAAPDVPATPAAQQPQTADTSVDMLEPAVEPPATPAVDAPQDEAPEGGQTPDGTASASAAVAQVLIPLGTNLPGCEDDSSCLVPSVVETDAGGIVSWTNQDTSSHTVTSGSPATGPTGIFDSSLIISGETFEYTFEEPGSYEYFCLVHPWVVGTVQVN